MRKIVTTGAGAMFALGLAAGALAGGYGGGYGSSSTATTTSSTSSSSAKSETFRFKARLTAAQEVPKPKASAGAGTFIARTVEKGSVKTFTWKLTFHGLTGPAGAAHVHFGKKGVPGAVAIALCGPCKSGQTGTLKITSKAEDAMETGRAYVNVHTAKNTAGEIRGQVALSK